MAKTSLLSRAARFSASEKLEIIRLLEGSHLSTRLMLSKLGIPRTKFYRWHDRYHQPGEVGLQGQSPNPDMFGTAFPTR
ncbi:helix-turn-helix domain-containing protein [Sulfitobacter sp.]|uniref:helix-turn-helix domain-containing protein n=1 Tax=Sulfitobacter sp. TaxID=1903071 RepID=UPI0030259DDA